MKKLLVIALALFAIAALNGSWFDGHKGASVVGTTTASAAPMQADYLPPVGGGLTACTTTSVGTYTLDPRYADWWNPYGYHYGYSYRIGQCARTFYGDGTEWTTFS